MGFCKFSADYIKTSTVTIDNSFISAYVPDADGISVKVYIAGLLSCADNTELNAEQFANNLNLTVSEVYDSFVYWEQLDLVKIISKNPLVISYQPVPKLLNKPRKYKAEKYADFASTLQNMLPDRMITVNEYAHYFAVMEDNSIKPDALLLIIKYCVDLKGTDIGYRYIAKVIGDFISRDLTTFESINNELSSYVLQSSDVALITTALKLKRRPELEDVKLYEKWTNSFGFSLDNILFAISKLKKNSIEKLDEFLTELYNLKLFTKQEINTFIETKEYLKDLTIKINKTLSVYYEVLEPEIETYTSVWTNMGYTEESLLFLATYCFKANKRSMTQLNELVNKLFEQGAISFKSVLEYFEEINAQNDFILELFKELSVSRNVVDWDRERLKTWKIWGFSEEMIRLACKQASGKNSPFAYVNTILSNWKTENIFTPDKIKKVSNLNSQNTPTFSTQRQHDQSYFDELLGKLSKTDI